MRKKNTTEKLHSVEFVDIFQLFARRFVVEFVRTVVNVVVVVIEFAAGRKS